MYYTSQSMTDGIHEAASRYASPGTEIVTLQPYFGAEAVDCNFESYLVAVGSGTASSPMTNRTTRSCLPAEVNTAETDCRNSSSSL